MAAVVMRLANYRANETYYPHTITILRLDRPRPPGRRDPSAESLLALLPVGRRPGEATGADRLVEIAGQIAAAEAAGNAVEAVRLRTQLVEAATRPAVPMVPTGTGEIALTDSVTRGIEESIALRETVEIVEGSKIAAEGRAASALHREEITEIMDRLGLAELSLVRDLPIITSTFGFTRRAFSPTYDEEALGATGLSTQLRAFYPLDNWAARRQGRPDLAGTIPLLAREAEHEGILFRLDPNRTFQWLASNGALGETPCSSIVELLPRLEPVDRYYDDIWNASVHRWVFGLIHTMAHSAMRVVARLAGLERTSIAEYLFLPLVGFVIFANGAAGDLGNLETVLRDHQLELLQELALEGVQCIYDPDCIDRGGACHGCVHSPEICCRAFNHGLSRALLLGGHVPWVSSAIESDCVGYW